MEDKYSLSLFQAWPIVLQRQFSHSPCPGQAASAQLSLHTWDLFQARLCQEFCSLFQLLTLVGLLRFSEH